MLGFFYFRKRKRPLFSPKLDKLTQWSISCDFFSLAVYKICVRAKTHQTKPSSIMPINCFPL
jgi:hypothetical protein